MRIKLTLLTLLSFFTLLSLTAERSFAFANCGDTEQFGCRHVPGQVSLVCGCYSYPANFIPATVENGPTEKQTVIKEEAPSDQSQQN